MNFDSPIQEIKDRLNILDVVQDFVQLKKAGTNYRALCPFHNEKTPSFMVSPSKQIWHCFGCSLGGDVFEFIKQVENVEFNEALKILADRAGVELRKPTVEQVEMGKKKEVLYEINKAAVDYFSSNLWKEVGKEALEYLRGRGLTDQAVKSWQLGFAMDDFHALENTLANNFKKPDIETAGLIIKKEDGTYFDRFRERIMFPITNLHGQVVGFTGRQLIERPEAGKYVNSPETPIYSKSQVIYGLYQAKNTIRKENRAILVEGNMDVISCHQVTFSQTIATSGTALTNSQLNILRRFCENLLFAFDSDLAGSVATKRALELALSAGFNVKIIDLGVTKDPDELIKKGIGFWKKAVETAADYLEFFFAKVFEKHDANLVEGKRQITKELVPLIYRIFDPVTRAHFVRKLSRGINVAEQTIWDLLKKIEIPRPPSATTDAIIKKDRRSFLEQQVLGLSLYLKNNEGLKKLQQSDFTGLNAEIYKIVVKGQDLDLAKLLKLYPDLGPQLELLNFAATVEVQEQKLDPAQQLRLAISDLGKLVIKKRMAEISQSLSLAERTGNKELLNTLSLEFQNLTKQLNLHGQEKS